jgi:hypothetical protein
MVKIVARVGQSDHRIAQYGLSLRRPTESIPDGRNGIIAAGNTVEKGLLNL